uniref:Retrovirus-related Pol polyprotein from transposon TNT 1-94 n=1 Tax=Tanacetum cinerariifolium TaxID=118510 RepID=A0A6L2MDA7_TANCI|nr:retrovirus-related Pol polyprotein from transposon TNT 1-94 [Tanacetum cinerariifolium]
MQKNLALIAKYFKKIYKPTNNNLRTSSNSRNKNVDMTPRYKNDNQSGQFGNQRTINVVGARENVGKTDEETDEQELEAHYSYMAKIQEVPTDDSGTDSEPLEHNDHNDVESDDERVALANLKLDVDENKKIQKQLKKSNTTLAQELKECKTTLAKTSKTLGECALAELQCLYLHKVKECDCLAQKLSKQTESDSKEVQTELLQCFAKVEKHSTSLEIALQKCKEQVKNDTVWNEQASNVFRKEREQYIEIQDMKAQLQEKNIAISELNKLIEKGKGKSVETKFDKPSVVRQRNAQRIPKPSVLGKLAPFSNSLERRYFSKAKSVPKTNVLEGMYRIDNRTTQTRAPQLPQTVRNTNPRVSTTTGVNHKTNASRPQYKSNQLKDKVMPNNSQVKPKKTQVKEHHRISSISNKTKSVTACNDSINSRTSNINVVCATCKKCLVDSDHFACVTKMLNDVNARTKKSNGKDLLIGNRGSDLYTISLQELTSSTPLCLMAKASPTQAWLWHRRLSHLNFDYINLLSKKDLVIGLPKLKYVKDQLCSSCELSKAKRSLFKSKVVPSTKERLNLLHMDLCGPMRVASINGKKYILVIVDDYSRYTWTLFLRSKDETPKVLKDFLTMIQRNLQASVITVPTDRGTEFLNKTFNAFFKEEGIEHQTYTARTLEQNNIFERRNRTLVEAARTMLSALKLPLFFWAEAIATACYTQN